MIEVHTIHISQVPDTWEAIGTYSNDMIYHHIETRFTSADCREYLTRQIEQLNAKIAEGTSKAYLRRWHNQRDMYQAILNFLNLHKIK
jgi:hypothetical protein